MIVELDKDGEKITMIKDGKNEFLWTAENCRPSSDNWNSSQIIQPKLILSMASGAEKDILIIRALAKLI